MKIIPGRKSAVNVAGAQDTLAEERVVQGVDVVLQPNEGHWPAA